MMEEVHTAPIHTRRSIGINEVLGHGIEELAVLFYRDFGESSEEDD